MKGISPFIAIILLIAITVSAGAMISIWWSGLLKKQAGVIEEEATAKITCMHAGILIWDATIECDLRGNATTTNPEYLNFTVENTGTIDLYNLQLQISNGTAIYGPYDVVDILKNSPFTSTFPLKPGWKRTVMVNITDDIVGDAEWIALTTQCIDVEDRSDNIDCTP